MKIIKEFITSLEPNEIFVFGSNLSGVHGAGAARQALKFGAQYGNPKGLQGKTYAIPTKDKSIYNTLDINEIKEYVNEFLLFADTNRHLHFLVTEIGCGLAGLSIMHVAPLFKKALDMENISLPARFISFLQ